ncbi:MAG: hypothetical protein OEV59_05270 [Deltaproteobacteria bacterium]|nr:hypothetical protein [Deltaproteobacteria bacterium]
MQAREQIDKLKEFIEGFMVASKKRGVMYGSLDVLEARWETLDIVFFILNEIDPVKTDLNWGHFISSIKNYGTMAPIDAVVKNIGSKEDPYVVLTKLREEYEAWRDDKIKKMKAENVSG